MLITSGDTNYVIMKLLTAILCILQYKEMYRLIKQFDENINANANYGKRI